MATSASMSGAARLIPTTNSGEERTSSSCSAEGAPWLQVVAGRQRRLARQHIGGTPSRGDSCCALRSYERSRHADVRRSKLTSARALVDGVAADSWNRVAV